MEKKSYRLGASQSLIKYLKSALTNGRLCLFMLGIGLTLVACTDPPPSTKEPKDSNDKQAKKQDRPRPVVLNEPTNLEALATETRLPSMEAKRKQNKVVKKADVIKEAKPAPRQKPQVVTKKKVAKARPTFDSESHDFGFIDEGDTIRHRFSFRNEGSVPYEINNVEVSCGCTLPLYSLDPIAPGASSHIDITYLSANKMGRQRVTIDVFGNTSPAKKTLIMTGVVR